MWNNVSKLGDDRTFCCSIHERLFPARKLVSPLQLLRKQVGSANIYLRLWISRTLTKCLGKVTRRNSHVALDLYRRITGKVGSRNGPFHFSTDYLLALLPSPVNCSKINTEKWAFRVGQRSKLWYHVVIKIRWYRDKNPADPVRSIETPRRASPRATMNPRLIGPPRRGGYKRGHLLRL